MQVPVLVAVPLLARQVLQRLAFFSNQLAGKAMRSLLDEVWKHACRR